MNTQVEPPPKRGMGCFAKGCLTLIVLAILLVVIGVGGTFWSVRHVYLSDKPAPIPQTSGPGEPSTITAGGTSVTAPSQTSAAVRERLDTMKKAARAHEQTDVELTAADINALIAAVFERDHHDRGPAGNQREQRAIERSENQRPQRSCRRAGLGITRSWTISEKLRNQICQAVRSNRRRNKRRQSNPAHQRSLIRQ